MRIVIPTTFTDTSLPVLRDDPILTAGSLMLLEPSHPVGGLGAGVPTDSSSFYNIGWKEAAAVIGSGTSSSLSATVRVGGGINNGTKGKVERTALGALHGIVSQSTALASGDGMWITLPTAIRDYIAANPSHRYYYSQWDRITRANTGMTGAAAVSGGVIGSDTSSYLVGIRQDIPMAPSGGADSSINPSLNAVGERFASIGNTANSSLGTSQTYSSGGVWGAPTGTYNAAVLSTRNNNWPSFVFRRSYLEDLTVSGRSIATVRAIDQALWNAVVNTTGGRQYGDTVPTSPSSIP